MFDERSNTIISTSSSSSKNAQVIQFSRCYNSAANPGGINDNSSAKAMNVTFSPFLYNLLLQQKKKAYSWSRIMTKIRRSMRGNDERVQFPVLSTDNKETFDLTDVAFADVFPSFVTNVDKMKSYQVADDAVSVNDLMDGAFATSINTLPDIELSNVNKNYGLNLEDYSFRKPPLVPVNPYVGTRTTAPSLANLNADMALEEAEAMKKKEEHYLHSLYGESGRQIVETAREAGQNMDLQAIRLKKVVLVGVNYSRTAYQLFNSNSIVQNVKKTFQTLGFKCKEGINAKILGDGEDKVCYCQHPLDHVVHRQSLLCLYV